MSGEAVELPWRQHVAKPVVGPLPTDLAEIDRDVEPLAFRAPVRSAHLLSAFRRAASVSISNPDAALIGALPALGGIQRVDLFGGSASDLSALAQLPRLETLVVHEVQVLESLDSIGGLSRLRALRLFDLRRLHSLQPLAGLRELRVLAVEGG